MKETGSDKYWGVLLGKRRGKKGYVFVVGVPIPADEARMPYEMEFESAEGLKVIFSPAGKDDSWRRVKRVVNYLKMLDKDGYKNLMKQKYGSIEKAPPYDGFRLDKYAGAMLVVKVDDILSFSLKEDEIHEVVDPHGTGDSVDLSSIMDEDHSGDMGGESQIGRTGIS